MTKKLFFFASIFIALFAACKKDHGTTTTTYYLKSVAFTADTVSVTIGGQARLHITLNPTNAVDTQMSYSSADTSIAAVNIHGSITAKKVGTVTITTTNVQKTVSAHCVINVTPIGVTTLKLDSAAITIVAGYADTMGVTLAPANATFKTLTWKSSSTAAATVNSNGIITGIAEGTANITATAADGISTTCKVQVKNLVELLETSMFTDMDRNGNTTQLIDLYMVNDTKSDITITEADVFASTDTIVPFSRAYYTGAGNTVHVLHPGQKTYFSIGEGDIERLGAISYDSLAECPADIYIITNNISYKVRLDIQITSLTELGLHPMPPVFLPNRNRKIVVTANKISAKGK